MRHAWLLRTAIGSLSVAALVATSGAAMADAMTDLIEAAKKEGELTITAVPHDWCNYAEVVADFKSKYPFLKLNELDPDAGSGDEIEAIKANKAEHYEAALFPTIEQQAKAKEIITKQWDPVVGANIQ